ncbi:MAG: hypothetical protein E7369_02745 [Clostridiales bacterium]|nr:hypothetical protein [Clostridiales bacterium]
MYCLRRHTTYMREYTKHKFFIARLGAIKKKKKTIYIDDIAHILDLESGEVLGKKKPKDVLRCLRSSRLRTENNCRSIVNANEWKYFLTLTFSPEKVNRYDDKQTLSKFNYWRSKMRAKFPNMFYWGCPERHKSGALHFHFLIGGVTDEELKLVYSGRKNKYNRKIYNVTAWNYGFSSIVKLEGDEWLPKVANYCMKYIRKGCEIFGRGKRRYWYSQKSCKRLDVDVCDMPIITYLIRDRVRTELERINAQISVYDIANADIPPCLLNQVQYCDFANNYCVVIDYEKRKPLPLGRLFDYDVISVT